MRYLTRLHWPLVSFLLAQSSHEIDSLQRIVSSSKVQDSVRLVAYISLAKIYLDINERQAWEYARKAFPLAIRIKDKRRQALSLYYQASALYYLRSYDQATRLLMEAESLMKHIPPDTGLRVQVLNLKGSLVENLDNPLEAKALYEEALSLAQQASQPRFVILTLINLAELYKKLQLYELAEENIQRALSLAKQAKEEEYQRNALKTLFNLRIKQGQIEEALAIQKQILDIARQVGIKSWIKDAYGFAITQVALLGLRSQVDSLLDQARLELGKDSLLWAELLSWVATEGFYATGAFAQAKDMYQAALTIAEAKGSLELAVSVLLNLANIYTRQALFPQAMEHLLRARRICEERKDTTRLPMVMTAIGEVYFEQGEWNKALEAFNEAAYYANLATDPALPYKIAANLAAAYTRIGNYEAARNLFGESKLLAEESEDWRAAATACINLARLDLERGLLDSALQSLKLAQRYAEKARDPYAIANVHILRGEIAIKRNLRKEAIAAYQQARLLLEPIEAYTALAAVYEKLIRLYGEEKMYDRAYALFFPLLRAISRVSDEESVRKLTRMELDYLHQKEKDEQQRRLEAEKLRVEKARQITWVIIISATLLIFAAGIILLVLYRANQREKEANAELARRNQLIEEQKSLLEEKNEALERANRDIEESIQYARRIQLAILPDLTSFYERFPESFVLYLPRDVVSGDFYYFYPLNSCQSLLAVADCTGHGVPGAFMSLIGSTLLNRIAQEEGPKEPAFILQRLDEELRTTLHHTASTQEKIKDGMDIALCLLDTQKRELYFAGARRPLFLFTPEGEFVELKGSRRSIGGDIVQQELAFEGHVISLRPGISFYLFSDGIVDQFGWEREPGKEPRRAKFMPKRLRQLLQNSYTLPAAAQKEKIENTLTEWRGNIEQIDDICIIGVRYME
ncbi:MAG: tetratricopeptide repeat protein [Bacteroidia bacterium]|nr:tetratricopeptide repeat protein [Bacteroidia bacterium]MDW8133573.1 tetratricopeptide repeat protein [Bacteroidia bacterium]